ncbi:hypothetical protein [Asticcacaulis sp. EMRT-3]|uniref:hypothetical protein n=1 Tax=Asticcacaulis sp. EMRT-3 TaxID=3040349 RepID=UPI0024AEE045|nr:hypothetical protein [Asticcacaulis sp. EMRT-3]MDI7773972.1 hypothetical protein [Asticcacaulis sp. EMRT-3]
MTPVKHKPDTDQNQIGNESLAGVAEHRQQRQSEQNDDLDRDQGNTGLRTGKKALRASGWAVSFATPQKEMTP